MEAYIDDRKTNGWLFERLVSWTSGVIDARLAYYRENPDQRPDIRTIRQRVMRATNRNTALSAGLTLVPGPFSPVIVPAELWLLLRNQVHLVVDVAVAADRADDLDPQRVLGLVLNMEDPSGMSTGSLTRRAVSMAGMRLLRRSLRLFFGRLVPVIGAAGVAVAARRSTARIGRVALKSYSGAQVEAAEEAPQTPQRVAKASKPKADAAEAPAGPPSEPLLTPRVREAHYGLMMNLLRRTHAPSRRQIEHMEDIHGHWDSEKLELATPEEALAASEDLRVNLPLFASAPARQLAIEAVQELVALGDRGTLGIEALADLLEPLGLQGRELERFLAECQPDAAA